MSHNYKQWSYKWWTTITSDGPQLQLMDHNYTWRTTITAHLASIEVCSRFDVGHVGWLWNVLFIAQDVNSILARHCGPVRHIRRAISIVFAVNLGLGWALDRKACKVKTIKITNQVHLLFLFVLPFLLLVLCVAADFWWLLFVFWGDVCTCVHACAWCGCLHNCVYVHIGVCLHNFECIARYPG